MMPYRTCIVLALAGILWTCALALQRPAPRYSQQYMPDTSFTCRNKIVGSYYADPETDCQLFHVCVSVAGSIQDYKFLCPNDTAFDQESQTCADWYDVDCEAATLYYASDNFDLYRLGSGLESVHYDNYRSDAEPQDQLQRSESSDPIRSSANSLARVQSNNNYNANTQKEVIKDSSSGNYYNSRNNNYGKESDYENEKIQKEDTVPEPRKKTSVRKITRKQPYSNNGDNNNNFNNNGNNNARNNYPQQSTTAAPPPNNQQSNKFQGHYYNNNNNNFNQRPTSNFPSSTTSPRQPNQQQQQDNFSRKQNNQRYNAPASTYQPTTKYQETYNSYQSPSTTARSTEYTNNFNTNVYSTNQPSANNFNQSPSTTIRPSTNYNQFTGSFNQPSTTVQPSTNYQPVDYTQTFHQRNYNTIQRNVNNAAQSSTFQQQPTTAATTLYDNYSSSSTNNNNNNGQYNAVRTSASTAKADYAQTTTRYYTNNFAGSSYIPTTYSPAAKNFPGNDNVAQSRGSDRYNGQYEKEAKLKDNGQYFDRSAQGGRSTTFYDSTKAPKKASQYSSFDSTNTAKHFDSSTASYDNYNFGRASSGIGFSPASVNLLAETPRVTTPVPRRTPAVSTYNPSTFIPTTQRPSQAQTTPRASTFVSGSARPFSTTAKPVDATSARTKSGKKNDYDYAYYDNAGMLEYDGLELEHVTGNKESSKLSRN